MISNIKESQKKLTDAGIKATQQRIVILDAVRGMDFHPTADHIYDAILENNPTISRATVYKTLETFVEAGLLQKVRTIGGQMRYDPRTDNHGHVFCTNTDEIIDYYDEELNEIITSFFKRKKVSNLIISNISLEINARKIDPGKSISIR